MNETNRKNTRLAAALALIVALIGDVAMPPAAGATRAASTTTTQTI